MKLSHTHEEKTNNFGREKLGCVGIMGVVVREAFYDMFFICFSMLKLPYSRLFNLYFRQVFTFEVAFSFVRSPIKLADFCANVSSKSIRCPYFSIPISVVCLCYLLALAFFRYCFNGKIADGVRITSVRKTNWMVRFGLPQYLPL